MDSVKRLFATAVAGSVVVLASAGGAAADSKSVSDPRGDAPAALDIVRFRVDNGPKVTLMTASMRDLGPKGLVMFGATIRQGGSITGFFVRKSKSQARPAVIVRGLEDDYLSKKHCRGASAEWSVRASQVKITVPKSCLDVDEFEAPRDDFFVDTLRGLNPTFEAVVDGVDTSEVIRVPRA